MKIVPVDVHLPYRIAGHNVLIRESKLWPCVSMCGWMGFGIQRPINDGQLFFFFTFRLNLGLFRNNLLVYNKMNTKMYRADSTDTISPQNNPYVTNAYQILLIRHILLLHSFQSWLCNKLTTHE